MITPVQQKVLEQLYHIVKTRNYYEFTCRVCGDTIKYSSKLFNDGCYERLRSAFEQAHTRTYQRLINNNDKISGYVE